MVLSVLILQKRCFPQESHLRLRHDWHWAACPEDGHHLMGEMIEEFLLASAHIKMSIA
jgi:hypothetical protein